jgi:hypothetical protein
MYNILIVLGIGARLNSILKLVLRPALEWLSAFDVVIFAPLTRPRVRPHSWAQAMFGAAATRRLIVFAPVAQLDRAPGYEPGGREFESLRAHHKYWVRAQSADKSCSTVSIRLPPDNKVVRQLRLMPKLIAHHGDPGARDGRGSAGPKWALSQLG